MSEKINTLKTFIAVYILFSLLVQIFNITSDLITLNTISFPTTTSNILNFIGQGLSIVFNLIFYTIPNQPIINTIIWGFRLIIFFEIIAYVREQTRI